MTFQLPHNIDVYTDIKWHGRDEVWVWFFEHTYDKTVFYNPKGDVIYTISSGEELPQGSKPSLIIRGTFLKRLLEKAADAFPPSQALADHLKDAVSTRDRLLTMIEKKGL